MKARWRRDQAGVSEVVGTILILGMTVVLFSSIILWVSNIPAPTVQLRVDMLSRMEPVYNGVGAEIGVNITLTHHGGESLEDWRTVILVRAERGSNPPLTDTVPLHSWDAGIPAPSGILDGADIVWDIGERWAYVSFVLRSTDRIEVFVSDTVRSSVVWSGTMNALQGTRPPVFVDKWTDGTWDTEAIDQVEAKKGFFLFAHVEDPDGDVDPASVYATITAWYGSGTPCEVPLQMRDDGVFPDRLAGDLTFSLGGIVCMAPPYPALSWSGTLVLLNATDRQGFQTTTRLVLTVVPPSGETTTTQTIPSELWQYIGFVQIRAGEVWLSNLNRPYSTTMTYQPFRITRGQLNGDGGPLFHLKMANHGNRTIFIDGWTTMSFSAAGRSSVSGMYIVKPVDPNRPANAGGIAAYPGINSNPNDFQYAQVFDVDPLDQETGGTPTVILAAAKTAFRSDWPLSFIADSYFINILISGMAGPVNMTYGQILARWGPSYNPLNHLNDPDPTARTEWYAQVIPFIGMTVY